MDKELRDFVDSLNEKFYLNTGKEYFRPADLIYSDGAYAIKVFGCILWDSDNDCCGDYREDILREIEELAQIIYGVNWREE